MRSNKKARREAKRLFRLCMLDGLPDENRLRQMAQDVAGAGHRDRLPILAHLLRLVKLDRARRTAEIESFMPLPAELQTDLTAALTRRYGRSLATNFTVHPPLLGGVRIQVGSDVYDGSVRAGLAALEKRF